MSVNYLGERCRYVHMPREIAHTAMQADIHSHLANMNHTIKRQQASSARCVNSQQFDFLFGRDKNYIPFHVSIFQLGSLRASKLIKNYFHCGLKNKKYQGNYTDVC